jgi:oligopeptide/dipeptide ABC transporter ATP-binding protein
MTAILEARDLVVQLGGEARWLRPSLRPVEAVAGVSLALQEGESLGLVGESGCGKTTLGRTLLGIQRETRGVVLLDGKVVSGLDPAKAREVRRHVQYVHQDAAAALDPWWRIGSLLDEALIVHGLKDAAARDGKIAAMLDAVGLDRAFLRRYVHELSGGQLRRIAIARILLLEPRVIIFDEPTSGLDLSVQATVLRLIADLKSRLGLTYLLISHDLAVVERTCERVAIMYLGRLVEFGGVRSVFNAPLHPYTRALLAAQPRLEGRQGAGVLAGEPPNPRRPPSGCAFRPRCPFAEPACAARIPVLEAAAAGQEVACRRWRDVARAPHAHRSTGVNR